MKQYCLKNAILFVISLVWCVSCTANTSPETPQTIPDNVPSNSDESTNNNVFSSQESVNQTASPDVLVEGNVGNIQTPNPIGSSEVVNGWLVYHNSFYNYEISYPPTTILSVEGVSGFPVEEKPSNLTDTQYLLQLRESYPDDICLSLQYESGFISVLAPFNNGGKYAGVCPGLGVGDPVSQEITGEVTIGHKTYIANGLAFYENDGIWQGEFLSFEMDDGTVITFGGGFDGGTSFEEYILEKEALVEILASYRVK